MAASMLAIRSSSTMLAVPDGCSVSKSSCWTGKRLATELDTTDHNQTTVAGPGQI